jgi:hypothetical protein
VADSGFRPDHILFVAVEFIKRGVCKPTISMPSRLPSCPKIFSGRIGESLSERYAQTT